MTFRNRQEDTQTVDIAMLWSIFDKLVANDFKEQ